jgi:hypothetical protein
VNDFHTTYTLTRQRLDDLIAPLNAAQLNFRLHDNALTIAEMAVHVAGVELWFTAQLLDQTLTDDTDLRIARAATDGSVNDNPFPFTPEELTPELVRHALARGRAAAQHLFETPEETLRARQIQSALGPVIDGAGALARIASHPFYHQGQAYLIASSPAFPH